MKSIDESLGGVMKSWRGLCVLGACFFFFSSKLEDWCGCGAAYPCIINAGGLSGL